MSHTTPIPNRRPPAVPIMRKLGLEPDPWQAEVLESDYARLLLCCSRQAGKSTVVAIVGLVEALFTPDSRVLLVSRSHRQSRELFRLVTDFYHRLGAPMCKRQTQEELALANGSRIVCLPCKEDTIRGYARITLLVLDEAARVPDDLYRAVRPMLAVSQGRMICLSTPYGQRGFFFDAWAKGGDDWHRIEIPAAKIPRITPAFLAEERRALGESWFRQEYCCSFETLEGVVYPDFHRCVVPGPAPTMGQHVGGIDFGFRNPFAALWGIVDADSVLWLTGEHYCRQKPLTYHIDHMPRGIKWFADPSGANERSELRNAGFTVVPGINAIRPGIAAVSARLENDMLKVVAGTCPNLLWEAQLYRYSEEASERSAEAPLDEHNHALGALRYLIRGLDGKGPTWRKSRKPADEPPKPTLPWWHDATTAGLWTPLA